MHSSTLLSQLDDHLVRLLAAIDPKRVCSERPDDQAPIRMLRLNAGPRSRQSFRVDRQVRHLRALGLVARDGNGWSRTTTGDALLKRHGSA